MPSRDEYYFGSPLKEIDYYAFPRAGSHLLYYCMTGLFDLMTKIPDEVRRNPEAASRQNELRPEALYSLELRESGAPFAPLFLNIIEDAAHEAPQRGDNPILMLIRHPLAAAYSAWCTRNRLGFEIETSAQVAKHLDWYQKFYDAALQLVSGGAQALLIRYEDLVTSSIPLSTIVAFVGAQPKLSPQFVHWITQFDRFVAQGNRTFYKAGNDAAWRGSEEFLELLAGAGPERDFARFGYDKEDTKIEYLAPALR
jgi:hypothetical protein